jgi:SOS response regulatory protein OraA/RecX
LVNELAKLLKDEELRKQYGQRGLQALEISKGATEKIINEVLSELKA